MNEKIKVGVIGVGKLGQHHARVYAELPDAELIGVVDIDKEQAQYVAQKNNTSYFGDIKDIINKVEAVSIAVPTSLHYDTASQFIDAGVHCLVEKPITVTLDEAEKLVKKALQKNVTLQIGHIERYNPAVISAQQYIKNPRFIEVNRLGPYDPRASEVGVVLDLMIHDLDILLFLTGSRVLSLESVGTKLFSKFEDIANARIKFSNGCIADVSASRVSIKKFRKIRIFQEDSYISLDYEKQSLKVYRKKKDVVSSLKDIEIISPKFKKNEPLLLELEDFIRCVKKKETPLVDGVHGRNALELALEIAGNI
ncbi:Gfo/Idh/MocA family protein [bacterium]